MGFAKELGQRLNKIVDQTNREMIGCGDHLWRALQEGNISQAVISSLRAHCLFTKESVLIVGRTLVGGTTEESRIKFGTRTGDIAGGLVGALVMGPIGMAAGTALVGFGTMVVKGVKFGRSLKSRLG